MIKQIIIRGLIGIPLGVFITTTVTIGYMYLSNIGSIERSVLTNYYIAGSVLGAIYSASSVIWDIESYSMARQLGQYFIVIYISYMLVAYMINLFPFTVLGVLLNTLQFAVVYVVLVIIHYYKNKSWVHSLNNKIENNTK